MRGMRFASHSGFARSLAAGLCLAAALLVGGPAPAVGQDACDSPWTAWAGAGGITGIWLRACDLLDESSRPSAAGLRESADPSRRRRNVLAWRDVELRLAPVVGGVHFNSAFPYVFQGEGVWAGKGLTLESSAGASFSWSGLRVRVEPRLMHTRNADYAMPPMPAGRPFAYPRAPTTVDLPNRFGDEPWSRLVPGSTTASFGHGPLVVGVSTAPEVWGPGQSFPLMFGLSSEGIPRVFYGLEGLSFGPLGRAHMRAFTGKATGSDWAPMGAGNERLVSGLLLLWQSPGGQLEFGGTRIEHRTWPGAWPELSDLVKLPVDGLAANYTSNRDENGLASAFARWRIPGAGMEIYGEVARDDWWRNVDDLFGEPKHTGVSLLGFARSWQANQDELRVVRAEAVFARQAQDDDARGRPAFGVHNAMRDGHTHRGGMLGTPATLMGGGIEVSYRRLRPLGYEGVVVRREDQGELFQGSAAELTVRSGAGRAADVLYGIFAEAGWPWGPVFVEGSAGAQINVMRYLERDVWNFTTQLRVRWLPPLH